MEGPGWTQGDKSGGHRRGQIHNVYGWNDNHGGGKRRLDSWCFVDLGSEEKRRIKDDSLGAGWMNGAI